MRTLRVTDLQQIQVGRTGHHRLVVAQGFLHLHHRRRYMLGQATLNHLSLKAKQVNKKYLLHQKLTLPRDLMPGSPIPVDILLITDDQLRAQVGAEAVREALEMWEGAKYALVRRRLLAMLHQKSHHRSAKSFVRDTIPSSWALRATAQLQQAKTWRLVLT